MPKLIGGGIEEYKLKKGEERAPSASKETKLRVMVRKKCEEVITSRLDSFAVRGREHWRRHRGRKKGRE